MARRSQEPPRSARSWATQVEQAIREAAREGAFDNLPGAGEPLPDLGEVYDPGWWARKLVQRERLSLLPAALDLRRRVERELEAALQLDTESEVREAVDALNAIIARVNATNVAGPPTQVYRVDAERVLGRWRARRSASD